LTAVKTDNTPKPAAKQTLTLNSLKIVLQFLKKLVEAHSHALSELQEAVSRKRRSPNTNGKVQIRDKQTGKIYPSNNNCHRTLLRSGELKDLVTKGVFGDVPEKNNFG